MKTIKRISNYFFGIHDWYEKEVLAYGISIFGCRNCNKTKVKDSWWLNSVVMPVDKCWYHKINRHQTIMQGVLTQPRPTKKG